MNDPALQKTLSLILLIGIGALIRGKIRSKEALSGIKVMILSVALPATIFVALLKIEVDASMLFLPLLALLFNLLMLGICYKGLPYLKGIEKNSPTHRTLMMMLPSLAPGLSCFPFLVEYMGDEALALAALADVGNKIYVLILLYVLAMHWYVQKKGIQSSGSGRLRSLIGSIIKEPINLVILLAFVMLGLGINLSKLPAFLQQATGNMTAMMTPLILIFIGLAVKIKRGQFKRMIRLLLFRSSLAFFISGLLVLLLPGLTPVAVIVLIAFPQSACSFWPFAHISSIHQMEEKDGVKTFDPDLSLGILALSLPFSSILILAICSLQEVFLNPYWVFACALGMLALAIVARYLSKPKLVVKASLSAEEG